MTLVELQEGWRRRLCNGRERGTEAGDRRSEGDTTPAAAGAAGTDADRAGLEPTSPLERELHRTCLGDKAATAELVADCGHDRHRRVRGPTEGAHGDRLEPAQRCEHRLDTARAFGEPDCFRYAFDDGVSQRRAGHR